MARAVFDDSEDESWDGFSDDEGNHNIIDEVMIDEAQDSFYRAELKKMVSGRDKFASIPYEALDKNAKRRVQYQIKKGMVGQSKGSGPSSKGRQTKAWNIEQVNGYELYDLAFPPYNIDHLIDLSVENDTHYACIVSKAINIVGLGFKWREKTKVKEARQSVEDDDKKLIQLTRKLQGITDSLDEWIDSLNEEEDFNEVLYKMWVDLEATGNGYLEIGRNLRGDVSYIGHIPSATMRVRKWRDGYIQIVQDKLTFFRNYGDTTTPDYFNKDSNPNEVIHFKKHSPKSSYYGVPDIIAAMSSVAGEKFASEYNLDYFENKAVPRYALIVKGAKLSAQSERRILEYFRNEVKGKHHGTLYIPVPAHMGSNVDVKLEAIENRTQEASFEKYRTGNRESIAMVHRVPRSKLGLSGGITAAREDDKTFKVQVLQPEQRRVAKKLNRIVSEKTDMYKFEFMEYDLLDAETQSRIHDRYMRTGVENSNEVRAELGYHPRKGGDKFIDIAAESNAKTKLVEMQAEAQKVLAKTLAEGDTKGIAKPRSDPGATAGGTGGGTGGAPRKTTDGSPKNVQETSTPAVDTPEGVGTTGSSEDRGEQVRSTRR